MSRESLLVLFHYFGFFPSYDLGYFSCLTRSLVNALAPRTYIELNKLSLPSLTSGDWSGEWSGVLK